MAERRMFAKTIIDSDAFIDMPVTARLLYYDLSMRADDDGFVNSPKKIMRMVGASQDDLAILITKRFLIPFETGVVVIKHWKIHNYIQKDRYKPTKYEDEKAMLMVKDNGAYSLDTSCIQNGYGLDTQDRLELGNDRIEIDKEKEENKTKRTRFVPPSLDEVKAYCTERKNNVDPESFINFYESKGWYVGKSKMKDWRACVRTWEKREQPKGKANVVIPLPSIFQEPQSDETDETDNNTIAQIREMQSKMKG